MKNTKEFAASIVEAAMRKGASAAETIVIEDSSFSVAVRFGEVEKLKDSFSQELGLRVIVEGRQAAVSTSDFTPEAVNRLVEDAMELARNTSVDDQLSLPAREELAVDWPDLMLCDEATAQLSTDVKIALALEAEEAARLTDPRIINFEGGGFGSAHRAVIIANSLGFAGAYEGTSCSLSTAPVASENGKMQRDYWYDQKRSYKSLQSASEIGKRAAERALRKLGARKVKTQQVPIVFDPFAAASLLGHVLQAASGDALIRKSSFLVGKLEEKIGSDRLTVIDDGLIPGGIGSRPFDGEGLPARRTEVIESGTLKSYLLNTYTARKLGLKSTGNASRGTSSPPSIICNNLYIAPGKHKPDEIIRSVKSGFYVTELIGFGVNIVTGDYSRGASGLWIENGELAYPVEEVTIAGNLKDMLRQVEMVGCDLEFRNRVSAPTVKIESMTLSGE